MRLWFSSGTPWLSFAGAGGGGGNVVHRAGHHVDPAIFEELLAAAWGCGDNRAVRLLGVGVRFEDPKEIEQLEFFG